MVDFQPTTVVGAAAFVIGVTFGAVTQRTSFCTMGALSDVIVLDDWRRMRAWMLALAVALVGSQSLHATGLISLGHSAYTNGPLHWVEAILGGTMFGLGMVQTGGCGARSLVRLGAGNLKSAVVVLLIGLVAVATLKGVLAPIRQILDAATNVSLTGVGIAAPTIPAVLEWLGLPSGPARWLPVAIIGGGLAWWCLKDRFFRHSWPEILSGVAVGLLITAGWVVSGILGADEFDPVPLASFTFVAPIGGALMYLMTYTGATLSFGVATVGGVVAGAFVSAMIRHEFRLESFADTDDFLRHLTGAAVMGVGGVLALGCTIGQGLTAMSTLSLASPLTLAAIILGGVVGLKRLEEGSFGTALTALLRRE